MAMPGDYVGLNLGPLFTGSGNRVGLNLGVPWNIEPPEPVLRGLRAGGSVRWGAAPRLGRLSTLCWSDGRRLAPIVSARWGVADLVGRSFTVHWMASQVATRQTKFRWGSELELVQASDAIAWRNLGAVERSVLLRWGSLAGASMTASMPWRTAPARAAHADMGWQGALSSHRRTASLRWGNPALSRRLARLPWGPAKAVPWLVRPRPVPPDPDPDPQFPGGGHVALNLGCLLLDAPGVVPLNLGATACYVVRPQRRTYVVINELSVVRLPDRLPIEVTSVSIGASIDAWGSSYDLELADSTQLSLLKPTPAGPRQVEISLNGYTWTAIMESYGRRREWSNSGVTLTGRSRTALLAAPYAPGRVKATSEDRSMAQLVDEELADTGFIADYAAVDWVVPAGAWFYDATPALDAISRLAEASGGVVQSHPADQRLTVRARYPASPWDWRDRTPDHILTEDIVTNESLQMRSAPMYDAVVVTGELAGKGVTCKVRRSGEAGQLFAPQVSSPLINTSAAGAERGRNVLSDRGEQAAIDLVLPLFAAPLKPGEVGRILPLDLVEVVGEEGTWHGLCTAVRTEARAGDGALVIEQTVTLERHYTDAD